LFLLYRFYFNIVVLSKCFKNRILGYYAIFLIKRLDTDGLSCEKNKEIQDDFEKFSLFNKKFDRFLMISLKICKNCGEINNPGCFVCSDKKNKLSEMLIKMKDYYKKKR